MYVTIAICTYNRAEMLGNTLKSLSKMKIPVGVKYHYLVIDNNSTDNTQEVIKSYSGKMPLESFIEIKPGSSNARNAILAFARGDYVLCTDDDVEVNEDFFVSFVECTRKYPNHVVFGGLIEPWFEVPPDPDLSKAFPLLAAGFTPQKKNIPEGLCPNDVTIYGVNMGFKLSATQGIKYDTRLGVSGKNFGCLEDTDFVDRVNLQNNSVSVWCPSMKVKHFIPVERTTIKYLTKLYTDRTASFYRRNGLPASKNIFGMPRWALRSLFLNYIQYVCYKISFSNYKSLYHLSEYSKACGVINSLKKTKY